MTTINVKPANHSGESLKDWRLARGFSQSYLAELWGVTYKTIANWEKGVYPVPDWVIYAAKGVDTARSCGQLYRGKA
jgi:DNA-binding XRE family transcriptional regulator